MGKINVLLTGGSGTLGKELIKIYDKDNFNFSYPSSSELNITKVEDCENAYLKFKPDIVIHAAAYTNTKKAEEEYVKCADINVCGTINMLKYSILSNCKFVYISTDYVFDGTKGNYSVNDYINPISKYSKTKAAAELIVKLYEKSLIIRTSFYGYDFPYDNAYLDQWSSKDYINILAPKILNECLSDKVGIIHCGSKRRSIYEIAKQTKSNVTCTNRPENIPFDTSFFYEEQK